MKKTVLLTALLVMFVAGVMAVPAYKGIVTKTLPDGSTIDLLIHGDEYYSFVTTADGYLVKQMDNGYYQYASMVNGQIQPLGVRAVNSAMRSAEEKDMLARQGVFSISDNDFRTRRSNSVMFRKQASDGQRIVRGTADAAYSKNLVILVNFADKSFTKTNTNFTNMFNQAGYSDNGATGSVKDYFRDNSYSQFVPTFDVFGPVTLDHNMAYYGENDADEHDIKPAQMTLDAVRKLNQSTTVTVNWSDYDCDGDGYIDNVIIYYAGYGENMGADADCIWPHQWYVTSDNSDASTEAQRTFGGKVLSKYICMNELYGTSGTTMCGIGTFCHEFSHALGLMDLYVTDYSSNHKTVGDWDLMCSGSYNNYERTPSGYSLFERFYVGWSTPVILNEPATITMSPTMAANQCYVVTSTGQFNNDPENPTPDVYYIFENRQKTNWDACLPGHGLLVEKISWDAQKWYYNVGNNDPDDMVVDIIEAGNSTVVDCSASDPFPGTNNVTSFTPYANYPLTNISESSGTITFDFMGGGEVLYSVYFNAGRGGEADTLSMTQHESGDTIILPSALMAGMDFEGWSYDIEASQVNAGLAGQEFVPIKNTLLHAVYSVNGHIVPNSFTGCFVEKFSKLKNNIGEDVTATIDQYSNNKGWTGNLLTNNNKVLQVGSDDFKGYITTPEIGYQGDFEVVVVVSQDAAAYLGVVTDDSIAAGYELVGKGMGVAYFDLEDVSPNSRLTFSSDIYSFNIIAVYICGEEIPAGVEEIAEENSGAVLIRSYGGLSRVENLEAGSIVRVIDALGRVLSEEVAGGDVYSFEAPDCFYLVEIIKGNKREVLK